MSNPFTSLFKKLGAAADQEAAHRDPAASRAPAWPAPAIKPNPLVLSREYARHYGSPASGTETSPRTLQPAGATPTRTES